MKRLRKSLLILAIVSAATGYAWYRWQRRAPGPLWEPAPEPAFEPGLYEDEPAAAEEADAPAIDPIMPAAAILEGEFQEMEAEDAFLEALLADEDAAEAGESDEPVDDWEVEIEEALTEAGALLASEGMAEEAAIAEAIAEAEDDAAAAAYPATETPDALEADLATLAGIAEAESELNLLEEEELAPEAPVEAWELDIDESEPETAPAAALPVESVEEFGAAAEPVAAEPEEAYPWPWQRREGRPEAEVGPAAAIVETTAAPPTATSEADAARASSDRWLWPWQRRAPATAPIPAAPGPEPQPETVAIVEEEPVVVPDVTPDPEPEPVEVVAEEPAVVAPFAAGQGAAAAEEPADEVSPVTLVPEDLVAEADRPNGAVLFDEGLAETRTEPPAVETAGFDAPWQEAAVQPPVTPDADVERYFVPETPRPEPVAPPEAPDALVEAAFAEAQDLTVIPEDLMAEAEAAALTPVSFDEQTMAPAAEPETEDRAGFRWPWQKPATGSVEEAPAVKAEVATPPQPEPEAPADTGFRWPWQKKSEGDAPPAAAPSASPPLAVRELDLEAPAPPTSAEWQDLPAAPIDEGTASAFYEEMPTSTAAPQAPASFPLPPPPAAIVQGPPEPQAPNMPLTSIFDEALDSVRPEPVAPATGRGAESYLDEGNVYFNVGQYGLAVERYTRAVEIDPNLTAGYYNRANARTRSGDYELALGDYNRALELEPNDADALNNRGMLHLYRANYTAAQRDFNTALTIDPSDTTVIVNRGLAHLHGGDAAAALVDFQEAAALDDTDAAAHYGAGQAAAALGNRDEALRRIRRALQVDPAYAREAAADPKLASLQGDAEFMRILREAGGRR